MTYNVQPSIDAVPLGTSADVRTIPASPVSGTGQASQSDLFPAETSQPVASGGLPPSRLDFNALFKLLGASTYFIQHGGVFGYDATLNYDKGALVRYDDMLYMAVAANGTGETIGAVTPGTDATVWLELGGSEGPWATDRDFRLTDYDAVHSTATYQLNQGDTTFTVVLPSSLDVQTLASGTAASGISYEVKQAGNAYYISVTGVASAISADNPSTVMDGVTGVTVTRHVTSNVGTQQTAILRTGATVPSGSGITAGAQVQVKTDYETGGGSGSSAYGTVTRIASDGVHCTSTGTAPASWSDTTETCANSNGATVTLKKVHHTDVSIATSSGIGWRGFNTVGSTILCCRMTETLPTANQYGELVAGSDLAWAAMDVDGGQINFDATGSLGLTGTWVKVSGQSIKYYGPWGMGLYRRIL